MKKITTGTGIGRDNLCVPIKDKLVIFRPYGNEVAVRIESSSKRKLLEEHGWTIKSKTHAPDSWWANPPEEVYKCIEYKKGCPHYDGEQTLRLGNEVEIY